VALDLSHIVAVLKPPLWEVDARAGGVQIPALKIGGPPRLSTFLRGRYPRHEHPLLHCCEQQFGIIHRLDAPSSGLILAGKTFQGYYTLRWQQDTYELGREYLVLCHGRLGWGERVISARLKTSKTSAVSWVADEGKPAWTRVDLLCVLERSRGEVYSFVKIMIRTGRTHQIRVHLQHIGHSTVSDNKYTDHAVYSKDSSWCDRNFLHRYRLTFQDTDGLLREVLAPLPSDLMAVLRKLRPADERSASTFRQVLVGWVPNAGFI